jgi:hypothetical protein
MEILLADGEYAIKREALYEYSRDLLNRLNGEQ